MNWYNSEIKRLNNIAEKSKGLIDAIKKGAKDGEKLAKDVTRKIAPEKGLTGTLKDTAKLGKEVKYT